MYAKLGADPAKGREVFLLYYIIMYTCTRMHLDFIRQ